MKDRFGNYVFQKIFEKGSEKQKKKLFDAIKIKLINLSEHCYGCRVVQKAIEYSHSNPELQEDLLA
jgi:pumilio RNA-binding family